MLAKFAGTHIQHGILKAGIAFYPSESDESYAVQYVSVPIIPPEGIPEGLTDDELTAWLESLPTKMQLNPAFTHFLRIDANTTLPQLESEIQRIFTPDVLTSADEFLSVRGTKAQERRGFSLYRKLMQPRERLGSGLVLPKGYKAKGLITAANNKFKSLGGELDGKGKIIPIKPGTVDIGAAATDRGSTWNIKTETNVSKENPANENGSIASCEIWLVTSTGSVDVWAGTFSASGNVLTCRDSESIGNIPAGSKQTASGLDITAVSGDYFGTYAKTGTSVVIESDTSGEGLWYFSGECIDASDSETFGWYANQTISLYGEGAAFFYQNTGQGVITPTGALSRNIFISTGGGAITPTGALSSILRFIQSVGGGAITPTGALSTIKRFILSVGGGSIAPTGALSTVRKIFQSVGQGAIAPVGALNRLIRIAVGAGSIIPTGALATLRQIFQSVGSGAITPVGALGRKILIAVGAGAITPTGALNRLIKIATGSGAITPTGALNRLIKITVGAGIARYEYYNTGDNDRVNASAAAWYAQTFTPSISHKITSAELLLYREGSPGTLTVSIQGVDGSGHPDMSDLCSGTTDGDTLPTGSPYEKRTIALGAGANLTASTQYAIVIRALSGDEDNNVSWRIESNSPTYTGGCLELSEDSGSSWVTYSNIDCMFEEWGRAWSITPTGALSTIKRFILSVGSGAITPIGTLNRLIKLTVGSGTATETLHPNAAGSETNIPSQYPDSTYHWDKVDEAEADEASTYVCKSGAPAWTRDLYALPAHTGSGAINKVTLYFRCKYDVVGGGGLDEGRAKGAIKTNDTVYETAEKNPTSWQTFSEEWAQNPSNAHAWTWDEIDALEAGISLCSDSGGCDTSCTQVYVEVNYGGIAPIGALGRKIMLAVGSGAITPTSTLGRVIKRLVGQGAITPIGALNRLIKITVGQGTITPTGALSIIQRKVIALTVYLHSRSLTVALNARSLTVNLWNRALDVLTRGNW